MQRLRTSGTSIFGSLALPCLKKKAWNSWSAVQDTYFSTKDVFERHRVVFTVSTSIASVVTAWAGYSLRYHHQSKVEERLSSIEKAMTSNHHVEHEEIKKIVNSGNVSSAACVATAGATLILGYILRSSRSINRMHSLSGLSGSWLKCKCGYYSLKRGEHMAGTELLYVK